MKQYAKAKGMMRVDAMGMGGVMMKREVFDMIDFPYFLTGYSKVDDYHKGEDVHFFKQCKKEGVDVWCDADLHYGHIQSKGVI